MNGLDAIVAATDLSAGSKHALDRAASLAQEHGAALTLVHVLAASAIDALRRWVGDAAGVQALEHDARAHLTALADELRQRYALQIEVQLPQGHPVQQLVHTAQTHGADLVVTGTRGAGFVRAGVLGSTAERVARRAVQPVLMVRQLVHERYRRVLVAVDFSDWSLAAVRLAARVAPGATLVLMHAVSVPMLGRMRLAGIGEAVVTHYRDAARAEARHQLHALAERSGLPAQRLQLSAPLGETPWVLIAEEEQARDCDLVVIGRQGRHAVDELLLGSTTRRVLAECSADVLISVGHDAADAAALQAARPPAT